MLADVLDFWKENIVLRIVITFVLWAIIGGAMWFFDFYGAMVNGWGLWLFWVTLVGFLIAGISLIFTPYIEQLA